MEIFHYTCCESGYWLSEEIYKSISNLKDICLQVTAVVLNDHVSKVFVIVHLMKYNRNHFLNRMKFVFLRYYFDLLYGATDVSAGYISRRILDDIYELDEKLQGNLSKASNLTYKTTHPGNNKQDVLLAFTVFDETTTATFKSYN